MCHCGHKQDYEKCCGRFFAEEALPESAEELMRSRYSAFVESQSSDLSVREQALDYLHETHDPQTRGPKTDLQESEFTKTVQFTGLQVLSSADHGNKGKVEFVASYRDLKTGDLLQHHELSQFRKQGGRWYYRQGKMIT